MKEKNILDNNIILYRGIVSESLIEDIENLENMYSSYNVWEKSSLGNLKNNRHTDNNSVIYLPSGDVVITSDMINIEILEKLFDIRNIIQDYAFESIIDYKNHFDLSIKKQRFWTLVSQKEETIYHHDNDNDGDKYLYSIIVFLNNNYSGGEFYFKDRIGNEPIITYPGDILIYPTSKEYLHKENQVTFGTKYYAVSYFG